MSDENGQFPLTSLNNWERTVVMAELARGNVRGWYRNPSRAAVDSLGIAYRDDTTGNWRSMHPDFIFFQEVGGNIVASIIDPHGHHLDDALMKLKALATFAATYGGAFHRIEALAEFDGRMKVIDMKIEAGSGQQAKRHGHLSVQHRRRLRPSTSTLIVPPPTSAQRGLRHDNAAHPLARG